MCANSQHNQPLRLLRPRLVRLRVTERLPVRAPRLLDLVLRTMTNEHGLSAPLDDHVLSLWNAREFDFDLGESEDVGGRGHGLQEFGHGGLGNGGRDDAHGADHEVGEGAVVRFGGSGVLIEVGNLVRISAYGTGME